MQGTSFVRPSSPFGFQRDKSLLSFVSSRSDRKGERGSDSDDLFPTTLFFPSQAISRTNLGANVQRHRTSRSAVRAAAANVVEPLPVLVTAVALIASQGLAEAQTTGGIRRGFAAAVAPEAKFAAADAARRRRHR